MVADINVHCNICDTDYFSLDGHECGGQITQDASCPGCGAIKDENHLPDCAFVRTGGWFGPWRTTAEDLSTIQDPIHNPPHYAHTAPQPIEIIEAWDLGPHEANVIKYVLRAPYKGMELKDLKKARWYLDRKIWILEGKPK